MEPYLDPFAISFLRGQQINERLLHCVAGDQSILSKEFEGLQMPATLMFDMPNVKEISAFVMEGFLGI